MRPSRLPGERTTDRTRGLTMRSWSLRRLWQTALAGLCASIVAADGPPPRLKPALDALSADNLLLHIKVLASDAFEGRGPGTEGEEKTVAYLTAEFRKLGLKPGNPDGSYVQEVPLVGFQATSVVGSYSVGGKT